MIVGLQLVSLVFSVFMLYVALINFKKGQLNKLEFVSWNLIWVFTIFVVLFPDRFQGIAKVYFARTFDMMVAGAFVIVIFMVTFSYLSVKKMERKMEELVRKDALRGIRLDTKNSIAKKK